MDEDKFNESVEHLKIVIKSLKGVLHGISENSVSTEDIENVRTGLQRIQDNARACL
jgi:hypothetical protein